MTLFLKPQVMEQQLSLEELAGPRSAINEKAEPQTKLQSNLQRKLSYDQLDHPEARPASLERAVMLEQEEIKTSQS